MKISGTGNTDAPSVRRIARPGAATSFSVSETTEARRAAPLSGAAPIAALDAILALQGVEDSAGERGRGVAQGEQLLLLLDDVRDGLLAGGIPRVTLNRLAHAVGTRREAFADPSLQVILDEIELRARVELAKLEQADPDQR